MRLSIELCLILDLSRVELQCFGPSGEKAVYQEERESSNEEESTDDTEPGSKGSSEVYKVTDQCGSYQGCCSHREEIRAEKIVHVLINITVKTRQFVVNLYGMILKN